MQVRPQRSCAAHGEHASAPERPASREDSGEERRRDRQVDCGDADLQTILCDHHPQGRAAQRERGTDPAASQAEQHERDGRCEQHGVGPAQPEDVGSAGDRVVGELREPLVRNHRRARSRVGQEVRARHGSALRDLAADRELPAEIAVADGVHRCEDDRREQCSAKIDDVIRTVVKVGGNYGDVVQLLQQAKSRNYLEGRLVFDALPRPGRKFRRKRELADGLQPAGEELALAAPGGARSPGR